MEFPAILSHRGAVSKAVADYLCPPIQNSVGPQRFWKFHHLKHDRLEVQCLLNAHLKEKVARSLERPFPEPFSAFNNQTLYAVAV